MFFFFEIVLIQELYIESQVYESFMYLKLNMYTNNERN